ncbi:MAG: formate--tetrahydrofolate ligase [Firmicutes bacterium]|jgi:formate--tetrahydrofolate ligase|uniref:Formate--tetrahydrofolate ligase n=1 Tax=Sulfobacillus benefaciens TaxID=453960 RepID=A0A2T2X3N1_9FIRM|nr:formate--tetrahydrofolate ligase [Bacillota bacterium]MCL5015947.1 formate--tetrahydrofolate ligase [Bacillota bacterium]PSR29105.1 MAG: formate--tetrahydrofolate ligase [Sulfobacillus benefaciens]
MMIQKLQPITEVSGQLGLSPQDIIQYGPYKAKIPLDVIYQRQRRAKLVLMTSINPTPAGEGKTTMSVGLSQALTKIGVKAVAVLREPSMGPTFGMKGGATGGGASRVEPSTEINLHFTGDFHAITAAHNLLAAIIDNELFHGSRLQINPKHVLWKRVLDVNDRALRHVVIGLGGASQGVTRETGFDITAASEVMAVLTLAHDLPDLKRRLGRMVVAARGNEMVSVSDIGAQEVLTAILNEAMLPNLVQTKEHTPVIMHGGPFANIAHGCNSIVATEAGLRMSDVVITEAGFGADLGAEKFLDIKAPEARLTPDLAVVVVTLRALRYHGGQSLKDISQPDLNALRAGMSNLNKHLDNLKRFGLPVVVAINKFPTDTKEETDWLLREMARQGIGAAPADVFAQGGQGGEMLGHLVMQELRDGKSQYTPLYHALEPLEEKIDKIATQIYGADGVDYAPAALKTLRRLHKWGEDNLQVCIAKTQYSLSDNPKLLGRPEGFRLTIRDIDIARGAGYIVPLAGDMIRMPGLPKEPTSFRVRVDDEGNIFGIE